MDANNIANFNDALRTSSSVATHQVEQLAKILDVTRECLLPVETSLSMLEEAYKRTQELNFTIENALINAQRRLGLRR